ncbi:arsenite-transporting ATPase [Amycolatopsis bartoniae]|uniref:Arsenic-transporting ATPase n=1 Tax=Amycolatopsis bartoniae TaxID=941986 RepID=A0A8H9MFG1_9PSEU|nr:ArsA family ATPase [Amycolatopsis bartoniae]MBB2937553.1 arsenite-transporting ATPase [Amycolatopsis bartoniae]TVT05934.1 ArsA family ATPase [Amycolatopsis bartoniae]GHF82123.1 arsenic-transporting ATPase [Amycolatopsis bartoniae]
MRLLLFTGKGGVGKTTLAAATAAGLASRGHKTLVVSTDPAHSLGDAFAQRLGAEPAEVDHCLHAAQVDSRGLVDGIWQELRGRLKSALAGAGVDELDAEELTVLPGVDELLALTEVQRLAESGRWDTVVVDCGPTAETLRLLALPEAVSGYLNRMWQVKLAGPRGTVEAVRKLAAHLESLRSLLTDPARTGVRLVLTPERVVVAEARRTLTSLALRGIRVDGLIVNRLMPAPGVWRGAAAAWLRTRRREQDAVLAELADAGVPEFARVEHRAVEPVGLPALLEISRELYGEENPLAGNGNTGVPLLDVSEVDGGYELRVAMPLDPAAVVDLARVDDELAITVDGFRRLVALPEALRPCRITGAASDERGLVVSFEEEA